MYHENWTMIGVTRCLEVASWPSFFPLAKSCRSRVCWVDMTSPLKQMAQFWSNYTPWIKTNSLHLKKLALGETILFFLWYGLFSRAKVVGCVEAIWIHHHSRHQEIAPTTPRELDVRAMVHFLQLVWVWCQLAPRSLSLFFWTGRW